MFLTEREREKKHLPKDNFVSTQNTLLQHPKKTQRKERFFFFFLCRNLSHSKKIFQQYNIYSIYPCFLSHTTSSTSKGYPIINPKLLFLLICPTLEPRFATCFESVYMTLTPSPSSSSYSPPPL